MSKRRRAVRPQTSEAITATLPEAPPSEGQGMFRRVLLAMLTALVVSRPFLRGESLGLSSDLSDPGGLIWALLVLVTCGAWAGWRLWSRQGAVLIGRAELCLFAGVALLFATAAWSSYRRAALLAGWEWVGLALMLFLARQLATSAAERQGLLAVLLATGVAAGVLGVYQAAWELPRERARAGDEEDKIAAHVRLHHFRRLETPDAAEASLLVRRLERYGAHGPFLYSSTLAGALALLVPGLLLAHAAARRHGAQQWQSNLAAAAAAIGIIGLILTREWLFILAVPVALAVGLPRWRVPLLLGAVAAGCLAYAMGWMSDDLTRRGDAWGATWRLVGDGNNGWTGVGSAQATFWLPRYLSETAGAPIGPESAPLELWAEGGIASLLLFAGFAAFVVVNVRRWWATTPPVERDAVEEPGEDLPWEFYLGGMAGIVLAFLVRASSLMQDELFPEAMLASLGALSWFAAFAVFEQLAMTPAERMTALGCGALALGLGLLVNPGLGMPSLTGLLFALIGVMLAEADPVPVGWLSSGEVMTTAPPPLFGAAAFVLLVLVIVPVWHTASIHRHAKVAGQYFYAEIQKTAKDQKRDPAAILDQQILAPLIEADRGEKQVVRTCLLLADWYLASWELNPLEAGELPRSKRAAGWAVLGHAANRESGEGLLAQAQVRHRIGQTLIDVARRREAAVGDPKGKVSPEDRNRTLALALKLRMDGRKQYELGIDPAQKALKRLPTSPEAHYRLARLRMEAGQEKEGREAAAKAKELDGLVGRARRLSDRQRLDLERWRTPETKK